MEDRLVAIRLLCRGDGVLDDERFADAAMAFGVDDHGRFYDLLSLAIALLPDGQDRAILESALNMDGSLKNLESRRQSLVAKELTSLSYRTIQRHEIQAIGQVTHFLTVLTQAKR